MLLSIGDLVGLARERLTSLAEHRRVVLDAERTEQLVRVARLGIERHEDAPALVEVALSAAASSGMSGFCGPTISTIAASAGTSCASPSAAPSWRTV